MYVIQGTLLNLEIIHYTCVLDLITDTEHIGPIWNLLDNGSFPFSHVRVKNDRTEIEGKEKPLSTSV